MLRTPFRAIRAALHQIQRLNPLKGGRKTASTCTAESVTSLSGTATSVAAASSPSLQVDSGSSSIVTAGERLQILPCHGPDFSRAYELVAATSTAAVLQCTTFEWYVTSSLIKVFRANKLKIAGIL